MAAIHDGRERVVPRLRHIVLLCSDPGLIAVIGLNMYSGALATLTTVDSDQADQADADVRGGGIAFVDHRGVRARARAARLDS